MQPGRGQSQPTGLEEQTRLHKTGGHHTLHPEEGRIFERGADDLRTDTEGELTRSSRIPSRCIESSKRKPLCLQATPTQQKFFLVVNLVQMRSVEELVAKLRMGKVIRKDKVIEESTRHKVFVYLASILTLKQ